MTPQTDDSRGVISRFPFSRAAVAHRHNRSSWMRSGLPPAGQARPQARGRKVPASRGEQAGRGAAGRRLPARRRLIALLRAVDHRVRPSPPASRCRPEAEATAGSRAGLGQASGTAHRKAVISGRCRDPATVGAVSVLPHQLRTAGDGSSPGAVTRNGQRPTIEGRTVRRDRHVVPATRPHRPSIQPQGGVSSRRGVSRNRPRVLPRRSRDDPLFRCRPVGHPAGRDQACIAPGADHRHDQRIEAGRWRQPKVGTQLLAPPTADDQRVAPR